MLQNSHEAGVGGLEGEILNGFVSFIKSIYECQKKGKDPKEAIKLTATETLKGGAYSYGIASGGSLLGGMMHNNANQYDFEHFFESPHHRQTPKAPREGEKGFGDHERADG